MFEWLGINASTLDDLAEGQRRAAPVAKTQSTPAPTLETIERLPPSAASLAQIRALHVKNVLSPP